MTTTTNGGARDDAPRPGTRETAALPCNYEDGRRDALRLRHTTGRVRSRLARCADYWSGWHGARPQYTREHGGVAEDPTRGGGWCMT